MISVDSILRSLIKQGQLNSNIKELRERVFSYFLTAGKGPIWLEKVDEIPSISNLSL